MPAKFYPLTEKGAHQAERNNSHQIWSLFSWTQTNQQSEKETQSIERFTQTQNPKMTQVQNTDDKQKTVSFILSKNLEQPKQNNKTRAQQPKQNNKANTNSLQKASLQQSKKQQSQFQKWKRKSIQKYIKQQVPYTRTLPNSAFRKFYNRPCPQTYGNRSTKQGGVCSGDFMKTHNIQPHTLDNKPQFYQTYTSALNYGKRTKLDVEDKWKRIERQLAKNLDYRQRLNMKETEIAMNQQNQHTILKQDINVYGRKNIVVSPPAQQPTTNITQKTLSLDKMQTRDTLASTNQLTLPSTIKRSKSWQKPIYYIYKYKEGSEDDQTTRYARDRHGITCYVDPAFRQNDQAYLQFQKKIKSIYAEPCKPEDTNIDSIRMRNAELSKKEGIARHYLLPNVDVPYTASKYSRKKSSVLGEAQRETAKPVTVQG